MNKKNSNDSGKLEGLESPATETLLDKDQEQVADENLTGEVQKETKPDIASGADDKPGEVTDALPEGVIPEPRSEEEMHLDLVKHSQHLVQAYLVSAVHADTVIGRQQQQRAHGQGMAGHGHNDRSGEV